MRPRILMIAYACDPRGSANTGWGGGAEQVSRSYEVELVTTPQGACRRGGKLPRSGHHAAFH